MLLRRPHDLGALLRDGRARAGWSQTQLADRVGVSRQWVSQVENGKTSVEFDLVFAALQSLGYRVYLESSGQSVRTGEGADEQPGALVHRPSERTPLTRNGKPLGRQRAPQRPREDRHG